MGFRAAYALGIALSLAGLSLLLLGTLASPESPLFFGEMWLCRGVPSGFALRPIVSPEEEDAVDELDIAHLAGVDLVPFFPETPPRLTELQQVYEVVETPFSVTLQEVEFEEGVTTPARLRLVEEGRERYEPVSPEGRVVVGGRDTIMREVRQWGGILPERPESGGTPLAVLALQPRHGAWTEDIVAQAGDWLPLDDDLVFRFQWSHSEAAAMRAIEEGLPGLESARWGIEEGGAINWFDSFLPGSGLQLADGTAIVLAEVRGKDAPETARDVAIRFRVARDGRVQDVWVPANGTSEDGLIRFEYPTLARFAVLGFSWEPGLMLLQLFENGEQAGRFTVQRGEAVDLDAANRTLRLDQALESAVYLRREDSPLQELVLEGEGLVLRLRQGETVRIEGQMLEFHPELTERIPVYTIKIERQGAERSFTLGADDVARVDAWRIEQAVEPGLSDMWGLLYAERLPVSRMARWGRYLVAAGLALVILTLVAHLGVKRGKQAPQA